MKKRISLLMGFFVLLISCFSFTSCAPHETQLIFDENPKIAVGMNYSLVIDGEGNIWSWGCNYEGQLGTGDLEDRNIPVQITDGIRYRTVDTDMNVHSYAIDEDGNLWRWGGVVFKGKGLQTTPVKVLEDKKFSSVSAEYNHTFVIDAEGNLWGWGSNESGALGHIPWSISDGFYKPDDIYAPSEVIPMSAPIQILPGRKFKQVSAGRLHFGFAIDEDGGLWCWGAMSAVVLEEGGSIFSHPIPKQIMPEVRFNQVSAGRTSVLAIDEEGHLWACGGNDFGQLGDGTTTTRKNFVRVQSNRRFVNIEAGLFDSYAIDEEGQFWVWGNGARFLEKTEEGYYLMPKQAMEGMLFTQMALDGWHQLLLGDDGTVWARGWNEYGQLGDGTNLSSSTLIPVFKR